MRSILKTEKCNKKKIETEKNQFLTVISAIQSLMHGAVTGEKGGILVKNHIYNLLLKFNIHNLIYDFLKFQISSADVESFIRLHVNFYAI